MPLRRSKISEKPRLGMNGNGMGRVDRLRRQHREDLLAEMLVEPGSPIRRRAARCRSPPRPASAQRVPQARSRRSAGSSVSRSASLGDRGELLGRGQPVDRRLLDAEQLVRLQPGDPDHEEFVEIVGRDRQEAQPLEQRMGGVARFLEHPAVERQPAQLAVEIALPRRQRRCLGGRDGAACGSISSGFSPS